MRLALFLLLAACNNPVLSCEREGVDCCRSDDDCVRALGSYFPYCVDPGARTGVCVECLDNADCGNGATCVDDEEFGGVCVPDR